VSESSPTSRPALGWYRRLIALPNDDPRKIVTVALTLCLVCSIAVSSAAVLLRPLQERNAALEIKREILKVADLYRPDADVEELFHQVEVRVVDLETGEYAPEIDADTYDQRKAARDPGLSAVVAPERDIASIKRRAKYASVYLVRDGDRLDKLVLPVHGYGLWSTMYGFLALEPDTRTVAGLTFYEHAETAGLGSEIANPDWLASWEGKQALGEDGKPRIEVVKGSVDPDSPEAKYRIDGLAGATLTANGVTNLMQYWLGEQGFGPYLERVRTEGA
jgi:Na+-transporting NADH:ubiquinone oxidoreductase subunit C